MKIQINITKEILERSMWCGISPGKKAPAENCAIALAVKDLLSGSKVGNIHIEKNGVVVGILPIQARDFIEKFDKLIDYPSERLDLEPFSFNIEIKEDLLNISIEEAHEVLRNSTSLELVE
jgi:hypothetical protein